jgi:hypothetical protein
MIEKAKQERPAKWYERDHMPYLTDRTIVSACANWVKQIDWQLFCTFTFAWEISDVRADKVFVEFINRLERSLKCDVGYVRGDEKRPSGCGKPACARHFHALLTSVAPMHPAFVKELWQSMAGNRRDDAGAKVEPYNSALHGAHYVLKLVNTVNGDWKFRKFELFHPEARSLQKMTARFRRCLCRHKARLRKQGESQ